MDLDTTQTCRICRSTKNTKDMQLLLEEKLKIKVEIICGIEICYDDELKYLCQDCETTIESSFKLRQLAQTVSTDKKQDTSVKSVTTVEDPNYTIELKDVQQKLEMDVSEDEVYEDDLIYIDDSVEVIEVDNDFLEANGKMNELQVQCRLCRRFVKQIYLNDHENKCNGRVTKYKCPFKDCNKRFVQRKSLNIHSSSQHFNQK